jgi:hypothetical protein
VGSGRLGLDCSGSGLGQVAGTCECGNEPSGSTNVGEFLGQLKTCLLISKVSAPWIFMNNKRRRDDQE